MCSDQLSKLLKNHYTSLTEIVRRKIRRICTSRVELWIPQQQIQGAFSFFFHVFLFLHWIKKFTDDVQWSDVSLVCEGLNLYLDLHLIRVDALIFASCKAQRSGWCWSKGCWLVIAFPTFQYHSISTEFERAEVKRNNNNNVLPLWHTYRLTRWTQYQPMLYRWWYRHAGYQTAR